MRAQPGVNAAPTGSVRWRGVDRSQMLLLVSLLLVITAVCLRGAGWWRGDHGDLVDFVEGGRSILTGREVYTEIPGVMPFNYPPFGAVVMVPFALLGMPWAFPAATLLSVLAYTVIVVVVARHTRLRWPVAAVIGVGGLALEPVFRTIVLGQVNLWLAALVVIDVFVLPRRFKGVLVGVAAGIKLTPAIFAIYYLFRRDWAAVARCAVSFSVTVLVGWVLAPRSSPHYWLDSAWLQRFVNDALVTQNQSLRAVLVRAAGAGVPETIVIVLTVLVVVAGLVAVWRQVHAAADLAAILGLAATGLVVAPISWTHHWVWVVPALFLLASARRWVALWAVGMLFFIAPMWFVPARGSGSTSSPFELLLGSSYFWVGLAVIGYLCMAPPVAPVRQTRPSETSPGTLTAPSHPVR